MIASRFETPTLDPRIMSAPVDAEQRNHHRREVGQELFLTDLFAEVVLRCRCKDLSAGGLYAVAPVGFGLAVGQRYELRMSPKPDAAGSMLIGDSLGYATIIRTQLRKENGEPVVGFAARFDSPRYLPL